MKIPGVILAGGLGTRLRSVESERPKAMVLVQDKPFLYWLIKHLINTGFDHFIFSIGYKADFISNYHWSSEFKGCQFQFIQEDSPLGTGGAVKKVYDECKNLESSWIFNGDTLLDYPHSPEPMSDDVHYICLSESQIFDAKPNVIIQGDRILNIDQGGSLFDAGQVFVKRSAVEKYHGLLPVSLHKLLQKSFEEKKVGYTLVNGECYDIGTPERLKRFSEFINNKTNE